MFCSNKTGTIDHDKPGMKMLTKLHIENNVPVVSRKSTYRKVTRAIHREPDPNPLKSNAAPVLYILGLATTCLKYDILSAPPALASSHCRQTVC